MTLRVKRASIPRPPGREEWLAARAPFVGASECAALFGEHPWITLGDLWAQKVERVEQADNPAMARGRRLEPIVAQWYADEYGAKLIEPDELYVAIPEDDELGVLCSTLDRIIDDDPYEVLEVKTSATYVDALPRSWEWQAQAQLLCTGLERVRFAVLDATLDLKTYTVEPDERAQAQLLDRARAFLIYVRARELPPDAWISKQTVERLYPDPKPIEKELDPERVGSMIRRLALARKRVHEYESDAAALVAALLYELGDATKGTLDGTLAVTQVVAHYNDIDTKRLRAEHPEIAKEYAKPRTQRRVLLREWQ